MRFRLLLLLLLLCSVGLAAPWDGLVARGRSAVSSVVNRGRSAVSSVVNRGRSAVSNVMNRGRNIVSSAANKGRSIVSSAANKGRSAVSNVVKRGRNIVSNAANKGRSIVSNFANKGKSLVTGAKASVQGLGSRLKSVVSKVSPVLGQFSTLQSMPARALNWVTGLPAAAVRNTWDYGVKKLPGGEFLDKQLTNCANNFLCSTVSGQSGYMNIKKGSAWLGKNVVTPTTKWLANQGEKLGVPKSTTNQILGNTAQGALAATNFIPVPGVQGGAGVVVGQAVADPVVDAAQQGLDKGSPPKKSRAWYDTLQNAITCPWWGSRSCYSQ